jgi:hypothetical protein
MLAGTREASLLEEAPGAFALPRKSVLKARGAGSPV